MPPASLIALLTLIVAVCATPAVAAGTGSPNPHVNPIVNLLGCPACHKGHGVPQAPMLPGPEVPTCLGCHGTKGAVDRLVSDGVLAAGTAPTLLSDTLVRAFRHPLDEKAVVGGKRDSVICTSCHAAHSSMPPGQITPGPSGRRKLSPKNPARFEFELCEGCHGNAGGTTQSRTDMSRLFDPSNRSYHPVEAPSAERSPSVLSGLSGREVNCTDCHGNDDANGPKGPHGSRVQYVLKESYTVADGVDESAVTYALCYSCHKRTALLDRSSFPGHGKHVRQIRASCATCHSPHGSLGNRALVRFGEETKLAGVTPSGKTGKLAFESTGPGSGACYLTCHGKDHAPEAYGSARLRPGPRRGHDREIRSGVGAIPVVPGAVVPLSVVSGPK